MTAADRLTQVLAGVLPTLAARRPIFHSEADFQLALAWEIQLQHLAASIRLEQRILDSPRVNLDVLVTFDDFRFGLELKYLRATTDVTIDGERFVLVPGAGDLDRYDTIKDVVRLETLRKHDLIDAGAAIMLSNNPGFWQPSSTGRATGFDAFRMHDGATLAGTRDWGASAGDGTRKGRELPHTLDGTYRPRWVPFSRVSRGTSGELRTLTLVVPPNHGA